MKSIINLLFGLLICSCGVKSVPGESQTKSDECIAYFDFDDAIHYRIKLSDDSLRQLTDKVRTNREEELFKVVSDEIFEERYRMKDITDTLKLLYLEDSGFKKQPLEQKDLGALNALFCERQYEEIDVNMCVPVYRDIIVFKKQNSMVGFAKICFDCDMSNIVGAQRDTKTFGQAGEFEKLAELLK